MEKDVGKREMKPPIWCLLYFPQNHRVRENKKEKTEMEFVVFLNRLSISLPGRVTCVHHSLPILTLNLLY
jgi:hypothetical protein